jgi:hypothetical protein
VSILSNRLDIFCWGGMPALAPDMACIADEFATAETSMLTVVLAFAAARGGPQDPVRPDDVTQSPVKGRLTTLVSR